MKSAVVGRAVIKPSTASFSFFRSLVHGGKPDIYGINDKLFCFLHGILVIGQAVRCPFLLYFVFQKIFFAKCPWQAAFFPVCEYAAIELPYLFQCGFTNTPEIIKNMTPEQLNEKVNEALENNESENIYPRAPHYAHLAVSQSIPKGTPLWPFGRFTKYQKMERQMKNKYAESLQTHLTISRRSHGLSVQ